jgi:hydroxypyruvate isomerase
MTLRFEPNLSILWPDRPLPERFARAADAGFGAVELWWPGDEDARLLPGLIARWGLDLALLNFDAGDMAAGERGLAADPERGGQLRAHVPAALGIAQDCGCQQLNLLVGLRQPRYLLDHQLQCAQDNVAWAADPGGRCGRPDHDRGAELGRQRAMPADHNGRRGRLRRAGRPGQRPAAV